MKRILGLWIMGGLLSAAGAVPLPEFLQGLEQSPAYQRNLQEEASSVLALKLAEKASGWQVSGTGGWDQTPAGGTLHSTLQLSLGVLPWSESQRNLSREGRKSRLVLLRLEEEREELRLKAISLYFRLHLLQQQVVAATREAELRSRLHAAATEQHRLGNMKLSEVQQVLRKKTEAEVQQITLEAELQAAHFDALSLGGKGDPTDPLPEVFPSPDEQDLLKALENKPAVQEARFQLEEAQVQLEEAQRSGAPELQVSGSVFQGNFSGQLQFNLQKGTVSSEIGVQSTGQGSGWKASATLRVPLVGSQGANLELAAQKVHEARAHLQEAEQAQVQKLRDELGKKRLLEEHLRLQTLTLRQAEESQKLAQKRLMAGLISEAEQVELQIGLQKSRLDVEKTRVDLYLQCLKLQALLERKNP
ncbi:TolC family protein [Deinococcus cellulosilyticus]|nr:TolC family protein [Deinococcus cellulosilyticus]